MHVPPRALPLLLTFAIACSSDTKSSLDGGPEATGGTEGGTAGAGGTFGTGGTGAGGSGKTGASGTAGRGAGGATVKDASADAGATVRDGGAEPETGTGDAGTPTKSGSVLVNSRPAGAPSMFANSVIAGFSDGPGSTFAKGCRFEVTGACFVLACAFTDGGAEVPAPGMPESGGTVVIGGTTPEFTLTYDGASQKYAPVPAVPTDHALFAGGDRVTFSAAGDVAPAFTASLVAPTPVSVTAPALTGGALSVDTMRDLTFTWTGSSAGELSFNVRSQTSGAGAVLAGTLVSCRFPASGGTGTIPSALLQRLSKTDATTTGSLSTDLSSTREVLVGEYDIHLAVGSATTTADGMTIYAAAKVTIF